MIGSETPSNVLRMSTNSSARVNDVQFQNGMTRSPTRARLRWRALEMHSGNDTALSGMRDDMVLSARSA